MNFKTIGTGAMYVKENSSCGLIDNKIMVDMPNGTLKQLLKNNIDIEKIDTILVTHMHGDHIADIPFFLKCIFNSRGLNTNIKIIGPKGIQKKILDLFLVYEFDTEERIKEKFNLTYIEVSEDIIKLDNYKFKPYEVIHGNLKTCFGYIINEKLGITGDCMICKGVEKIFENSKIVFADTSTIKGDNFHMGIDNVKYLKGKYNVDVIPTHLRHYTRNELLNQNELKVVEDFFEINI